MTRKVAIALVLLMVNVLGTVACQTFEGAPTKRQPAKTAGQLFESRLNN